MEFYQKDTADPDWLARISEFHGHLGPWLVSGALIGRDAMQRLGTPGHWKIDVICWMPADKHRTPFTCILDGLQTGCGATMGKRNLWLEDAARLGAAVWPVVHVIRLAEKQRPAAGLSYVATDDLHKWMQQVTPERIEELSRQMAREDVAKLFCVSAMQAEEMTQAEEKIKSRFRTV